MKDYEGLLDHKLSFTIISITKPGILYKSSTLVHINFSINVTVFAINVGSKGGGGGNNNIFTENGSNLDASKSRHPMMPLPKDFVGPVIILTTHKIEFFLFFP